MMRLCAWSSGSWTWKSSEGLDKARDDGLWPVLSQTIFVKKENSHAHASTTPLTAPGTSAPGLFSPGCSFSSGRLCRCTVRLYANALAPPISDGSLPLPGHVVSCRHSGVDRGGDHWRGAPLALAVLVAAGGFCSD